MFIISVVYESFLYVSFENAVIFFFKLSHKQLKVYIFSFIYFCRRFDFTTVFHHQNLEFYYQYGYFGCRWCHYETNNCQKSAK